MNTAEVAEEGRETRRDGSPTPPGPRGGRGSVPTFSTRTDGMSASIRLVSEWLVLLDDDDTNSTPPD